jgi:hypothetical protein
MSAFEEIRGKAESERMGDGGWGMKKGKRQKAKGKRMGDGKEVLRSPLSFFRSSEDGGWEGGSPLSALGFPSLNRGRGRG